MAKFQVGDRVRYSGGVYVKVGSIPVNKDSIFTVRSEAPAYAGHQQVLKFYECDKGYGYCSIYFELVPEKDVKVNKFKVGDVVVRVGNHFDIPSGIILVVNSVSTCGDLLGFREYSERGTIYHVSNFVLHTPKQESELETLVRKANEGRRALYTIMDKYPNKVEFNFTPEVSYPINNTAFIKGQTYRIIKPKPAFEPFLVNAKYQVYMVDDTLHIGCQTFNAVEARTALYAFIEELANSWTLPNGDHILASKRGLWIPGIEGQGLTWADAEKILRALQEYEL